MSTDLPVDMTDYEGVTPMEVEAMQVYLSDELAKNKNALDRARLDLLKATELQTQAERAARTRVRRATEFKRMTIQDLDDLILDDTPEIEGLRTARAIAEHAVTTITDRQRLLEQQSRLWSSIGANLRAQMNIGVS